MNLTCGSCGYRHSILPVQYNAASPLSMPDSYRTGLHVPNWIVQPFNLSFEPDDLHIMAFISDHPEYEAVEAMIRFRDGLPPLIRAIITRHDQSQVDHFSDEGSLSTATGIRRRVLRDIACVVEDLGASRRAALRFQSFRDELVELDVTSLGPPDSSRGGLSDPGQHSLGSSLPVMYRGRSALAAPASRVTIGGRPHQIPPRIEVEGRVIALNGFFTEPHHMATVRSAVAELELVEMPTDFKVGDRWIYRSAIELATYRLSRVFATGEVEITRSDAKSEWIRGRLVADKIALVELRVQHPSEPRHFVSLTFTNGAFAIGIDEVDRLVTGTFEAELLAEEQASIALFPSSPSWAFARPVTVTLARARGREISIRTAIGNLRPSM